jgi:hypothetical protein
LNTHVGLVTFECGTDPASILAPHAKSAVGRMAVWDTLPTYQNDGEA